MTFHRSLLAAAAVAALAVAAPAFADTTTTLSFDELPVSADGSFADTYLAAFGLSFTGAALSLQDNGGAYSNAPSPTGVMYVNAAEGYAVLSSQPGHDFVGQVSFYFSNTDAPALLVRAFAGADGTGTKVGEYGTFTAYAQENGCSDTAYCNWQQAGFGINGSAKSIVIYSNNGTGYDNLTVTTVPEPASYAMLAGGLLALGFMARRRRQG